MEWEAPELDLGSSPRAPVGSWRVGHREGHLFPAGTEHMVAVGACPSAHALLSGLWSLGRLPRVEGGPRCSSCSFCRHTRRSWCSCCSPLRGCSSVRGCSSSTRAQRRPASGPSPWWVSVPGRWLAPTTPPRPAPQGHLPHSTQLPLSSPILCSQVLLSKSFLVSNWHLGN